MNTIYNKELFSFLQTLKKSLMEGSQPGLTPNVETNTIEAPMPKKKPKKVIFDKSTGSPFEVVFSERGFLVEDTRMSFEDLEIAISKKYNIVLNEGHGLNLDAVKMQKILKYKDSN